MSAAFATDFSSVLKQLRSLHGSSSGQPFVLSGSGTLGWDLIAANLCERGERAVVVNTGYFSDSFADCLQTYGAEVTQVKPARVGSSVSDSELRQALSGLQAVRLVLLTQVDTSTAVLNDVQSLAATARSVHPDCLIAVDGVCSLGGEQLSFDDWQLDAFMSCSQKALGAPPGLCTLLLSPRALAFVQQRKSPVPAFYASLLRWLPIMQAYEAQQPAYFATPNVNLIRALDVSLQAIAAQSLQRRYAEHQLQSAAFKAAMEAIGLQQVPAAGHRANTLTALYYPDGIDTAGFLASVAKQGVVCAGGLHKDIKTRYFRVGHMGESVRPGRDDVLRVVTAIEQSLRAAGYKLEEGKAQQVYQQKIAAASATNGHGKL